MMTNMDTYDGTERCCGVTRPPMRCDSITEQKKRNVHRGPILIRLLY